MQTLTPDPWAPPRPAVPAGPGVGAARRPRGQDGMVTVEYAIGTIAAAALATLLWEVAHSPGVLALIEQVFAKALTVN